MDVLSFGSLNLDHVYSVPHFVTPGETLMTADYKICYGGKGLNQSIAAARAGVKVTHAGTYGSGGDCLLNYLHQNNVDTSVLQEVDLPQGHAIIQVSSSGENCIMLFPGSNFAVSRDYVDFVLSKCSAPGYLLLQNEISELPYIVDKFADSGFKVVLNASPYNDGIEKVNFEKLSWLLINEIEGAEITGKSDSEDIISSLQAQYANLGIVLTLGSRGCICACAGKHLSHGIFRVPVKDTTGAGDTFTGYFVASLAKGLSLEDALKYASAAAALSVSSDGAAQSIPIWNSVEQFLLSKE